MSHRHCLPYTKLLFISFFQAAELAVVPYSKGIQMGWTGLYVPIRKAFPHAFYSYIEAEGGCVLLAVQCLQIGPGF